MTVDMSAALEAVARARVLVREAAEGLAGGAEVAAAGRAGTGGRVGDGEPLARRVARRWLAACRPEQRWLLPDDEWRPPLSDSALAERSALLDEVAADVRTILDLAAEVIKDGRRAG